MTGNGIRTSPASTDRGTINQVSPELRADRRARLLTAMADHDLDVLVLSRAADVAFATGARQLWTAGARPFGPACIVVRETGRAHLLSVWDEGVPAEIATDELYGISWNPANLIASLTAIPGLRSARRVGTASSSPMFASLLRAVAPDASEIDGSPAVLAARAMKSPEELAHIDQATAQAESALSAMIDALRPGVSERDVLGRYLEHLASIGAPTPPAEGVVCATPATGPVVLRRNPDDRPIRQGQLVVLDPGAFASGYEGGVGRTWRVGDGTASSAQRDLASRCRRALDAVVAACRPGATGADLRDAWAVTGEPLPAEPIVHGLGLGIEPPFVDATIGARAVLRVGAVLAVNAWVSEEGVGGFFEREIVALDASGGAPRILSRYGRGPAAQGA